MYLSEEQSKLVSSDTLVEIVYTSEEIATLVGCSAAQVRTTKNRKPEKFIQDLHYVGRKNSTRYLKPAIDLFKSLVKVNIKPASHLYVISCGIACKIGITSNVRGRLTDIQVSNHREVKLEFSSPAVNARTLESFLHTKFKDQHIRGEWFALNIEDIQFIENIFESP